MTTQGGRNPSWLVPLSGPRAIHANCVFKVSMKCQMREWTKWLIAPFSITALFGTKSLIIKPLTQKQNELMASSDYEQKVFCWLHPESFVLEPPGTIWLHMTDRPSNQGLLIYKLAASCLIKGLLGSPRHKPLGTQGHRREIILLVQHSLRKLA